MPMFLFKEWQKTLQIKETSGYSAQSDIVVCKARPMGQGGYCVGQPGLGGWPYEWDGAGWVVPLQGQTFFTGEARNFGSSSYSPLD